MARPLPSLSRPPAGCRIRRGPRLRAYASAATPSGSIGPTRREDRSIGTNRRRWTAIVPRRTLRQSRLAKRGRIGLSAAQAHDPVRRREMAKRQKARGAGEAAVPRTPSSSERVRLEAAVASFSGLNAEDQPPGWTLGSMRRGFGRKHDLQPPIAGLACKLSCCSASIESSIAAYPVPLKNGTETNATSFREENRVLALADPRACE